MWEQVIEKQRVFREVFCLLVQILLLLVQPRGCAGSRETLAVGRVPLWFSVARLNARVLEPPAAGRIVALPYVLESPDCPTCKW